MKKIIICIIILVCVFGDTAYCNLDGLENTLKSSDLKGSNEKHLFYMGAKEEKEEDCFIEGEDYYEIEDETLEEALVDYSNILPRIWV